MTQETADEFGPVDYVVVEFPPGKQDFSGEMARELAALVDADMIRLLDLVVLAKDDEGGIEAFEIEDLEDVGDLGELEGELAEILALEDLENVAEAMEPGSVAGVLVWENTWAAPFALAARRSGGQLIASGRIPTQALIASFEADEDTDD